MREEHTVVLPVFMEVPSTATTGGTFYGNGNTGRASDRRLMRSP